MISKSFLSGIFSVVSFILVSNLVIPSTFALCPPDVSGTWVYKAVTTYVCCSNPSDNGVEIDKGRISVVQDGDKISASWVDEDGHSAVLTGVVNGNSVYCKIEGIWSGEPGCTWVEHFIGIIKGNRIKILDTGADTCDGCRWSTKGTIKIVK